LGNRRSKDTFVTQPIAQDHAGSCADRPLTMNRRTRFAGKTKTSAEPERPSAESDMGVLAPARRPFSSRPPYQHSGVYRRSHRQRRSTPGPEREDIPPPSMAWSVLIAVVTFGLVYLILRIGR